MLVYRQLSLISPKDNLAKRPKGWREVFNNWTQVKIVAGNVPNSAVLPPQYKGREMLNNLRRIIGWRLEAQQHFDNSGLKDR